MTQSVVEEILKHGAAAPERNALADGISCLTYKQLADKIRGAAECLKQQGLCRQDMVGIVAEVNVAYVIGYFAIHLAGGIAVPIDKASPEVSVKRILEEVTLKFVIGLETVQNGIAFKELTEHESERWEDAMPLAEDVSDIFFTSGTTGKGKGVVLIHKNIVGGARNIIAGSGKDAEDVELITPPLNHAYGFGTVRAILLAGGMAVLQDGCGSIKQLYMNLQKYHCRSMILVPAALKMLYKQFGNEIDKLLGNLSYIELGSSVLETDYKKIFMELLPNTRLCINYGSTESSRTVYNEINARPDKIESIGKAVENVQVRIVDEEGNEIQSSPTHTGRLIFYGDMNMKEYYHAPELTQEVLKAGWFYTNDIAYIDEENYIYLLGRANDVINIGGEKVSAFEIENALRKLSGIRACACIMGEDKDGILGEIPVLLYTAEGEIAPEDVREHMEKELELYKLPKIYKKLEEFPLNAMGKVDKKKLKEAWREM